MARKINSWFTFFIVLLPFLYQYKSPISVISLGELILIPFIGFYLINFKWDRVRYHCYNGYYLYIFAVILASIMASINGYYRISEFTTVLVRIIYYSLLILVSLKKFDINEGLKLVRFFSVIFSVYVVIQYIMYKSMGVTLPTVLNPNWVFSAESGNRTNYSEYYRFIYRPSSLFLEPSYYALFAGVGLSSALFNENYRQQKKQSGLVMGVIITVGMVVSTSSAALLLIIVNWFAYLYKMFCIERRRVTRSKLLLVTLLCVFMIALFKSPLAVTLLTRTKGGGSFSNRITRGFILAKSMNFYQILFGVGINNIEGFMHYNSIVTIYDEGNLNYVSSMIGTYLCSGVFAFIFYIRVFLLSYTKSNHLLGKILTISFFLFNFIEANSYSYRFAFFMIFILNVPLFEGKNVEAIKVKI